MKILSGLSLSVFLLAFGASAQADTVTVQLGSGQLAFSAGIPDEVLESGAIISPTLTLNVPSNLTFYAPLYEANCTTCTGSLSGSLTANLIVSDSSSVGSGTGTFSQDYSDVISGGTHTFTPLASSAIDIALSNGDTVVITPLAGTAVGVSTGSTDNTTSVSATFLLEKTPAGSSVPEPSSALFVLTGLGAAAFGLRKRCGQQS